MSSILASIPLFASLPEEELLRIESVAIQRSIVKGTLLFSEGDPVEQLIVLVKGQLKAFASNDDGREFVYDIANAGASFGELAMFCDETRSVSVEAETDCQIMTISRADFLALVDANIEMKDQMLHASFQRLKWLSDRLRDLALKDVYGRLRTLFEGLAVETEEGWLVDAQLSQQDMADRIGASREMIAKIMRELVAGEYVKTGRKRLVILKKLPEQF